MKIKDLASAMAPSLPHDIIGIRPGEKMHETMCSADDSHLTLEFDDHYVIQPTINFSTSINYKVNSLNETGSSVSQGFGVSSKTIANG